MTKKEFKKKCKEEKATSYKLMLSGAVVATIGFIIVLATMIFIKKLDTSIIGFALGSGIALIGMILDCIGEILLAKEFKEYK